MARVGHFGAAEDRRARVAAQRERLRLAEVDDHAAFFELDGAVFALVPGARVKLCFGGC
jgi:hypothetical protein